MKTSLIIHKIKSRDLFQSIFIFLINKMNLLIDA